MATSIVSTLANLRLLINAQSDVIYEMIDYGGGFWYLDDSDTVSPDNTGTILVTADSKRLKRINATDSVNVMGSAMTRLHGKMCLIPFPLVQKWFLTKG